MSEAIKKNEEMMETVKPYTLRKLETADVFPMFRLLNKIGFKDLKDNEGLKKTLFVFMGGNVNGKVDVNALGMDIFFEVAAVLFDAIPKAETEFYSLLASVAGVKVDDIKKQSPAVTMEMIVDFVQKEEFRDFFSVVSRLFK
jgi:hypothetical protein